MEDYTGSRNGVFRVRITKVDDSQTEQYRNAEGVTNHNPTQVLQVQQHGFSSNPPVGSHGIAIAATGKMDLIYLIGGEDPNTRPKNLAPGDTIFYNSSGVQAHMKGKTLAITAPETISFTVGNNTLTIDKNGFHYKNGKIDHDTHLIDKNHKHTDAGGSGLSGIPQ